MPKRDWLRRHASQVAIFFVLASVLGLTASFAIGLLRTGWALQSVSELDAEIRQKDYAQTGYDPEYRSCIELPIRNQKTCLDAASNAARENERADRDLVAKEVTAIWTKITAYAAIGGIVVSIGGLGLVFIAYREARKTNTITREIGQDQIRAYLSVNSVRLIIDPSGHLTFTVKISNSGQSPAINVVCEELTISAIDSVNLRSVRLIGGYPLAWGDIAGNSTKKCMSHASNGAAAGRKATAIQFEAKVTYRTVHNPMVVSFRLYSSARVDGIDVATETKIKLGDVAYMRDH